MRSFVASPTGLESKRLPTVRDAVTLNILANARVGQGQGPYFGVPLPVPAGGLAKPASPHSR